MITVNASRFNAFQCIEFVSKRTNIALNASIHAFVRSMTKRYL